MTAARLLAGLALALAASTLPAQDQRPAAPAIGRLFYTPQQRATLDAERRVLLAQGARPAAKPATVARQPAAESRPVDRTYTLQGIVKRSDGEATVWINNQAVHERHSERGIAAGTIARDSVSVNLPEGDRRVQIRVGQSVQSGSGRVQEPYRGRPLSRETANPAPEGTPAREPRS